MGLICGCSRAAILMAGLPQSTDKLSELHDEIELQLIAAERQQINDLYQSEKLKDEARRGIERELDLHQAHLLNQRAEK
jgi:monovalent cation/hydrogen antiporter